MNVAFLYIFKFALISTIGTLGGCALALYRAPGAVFRNFLLHFAAGVIFSVVAVEILPDIVKRHSPFHIVVGFTLGVLAMLLVKQFSEKLEAKPSQEARLPWGILVAGAVDEAIDGLLLGIGFAAGQKEGILLAIGLALEVFVFSLAVTSSLRNKGISKQKTFAAMAAMAGMFLAGVGLGGTILSHLSGNAIELLLSFGLAALLYLVTEELLVEAHEGAESPWMVSAFFGGFLLFLIIGMMS